MAKKKLTTEQRLDLAKGFGKGVIELLKSNKAAGYAATSLAILLLGKAKLISCGVTGTLQGVTTYIAISDTVEEGDGGFFGVGGMGETIAKGGTSIGIGALWGLECESGKHRYSSYVNGNESGPSFSEAGYSLREYTEKHKARPLPEGGVSPGGEVKVWWWPDQSSE